MHVYMQPPTQPTGPRTIPKLLLKNRGSQLSRTDALANRRALEAPLSVIVERAVAPVLTPEDSISVAKALSALVVKEANSTASVLEVATLRLPVLQHLASMWSNLPVRILFLFFRHCFRNLNGSVEQQLAVLQCTHLVFVSLHIVFELNAK